MKRSPPPNRLEEEDDPCQAGQSNLEIVRGPAPLFSTNVASPREIAPTAWWSDL